jgi:rare lipoprotein A
MKCAIGLLVAAVVFSGCAHKKKKHVAQAPPPTIRPKLKPMTSVQPGYAESGKASWYGHPYHGRPAADGEIYDMETMVAAHRTLPFQTWVRVYDLDNNKTVEVRIVDRGPFVDGRIIDLSHAAARAIEMIGPGTANVRMEVISAPADTGPAIYVVQVGAFESRVTAEQMQAGLAEHYGTTRVIQRKENPGIWRVLVGNEATLDAANALCDRIQQETGEKKAFAVRLDPQ